MSLICTRGKMYGCRQPQQLIFTKLTLLIAVCTLAIICFHWPFVSNMGLNRGMDEPETRPNVQNTGPNRGMDEPETRPYVQNTGPNRGMDEPETRPNFQIKHYDVLLSSYMKSGSTLTGMILGWRTDTFYVYEPLWKISQWTYWHGNNTVCRSYSLDCRKVDPGTAVQDKSFPKNENNVSPVSLVMAMKILRNIFDCQFNDFERTVVHRSLTVVNGGPSWNQMTVCMKNKRHLELCLHRIIPGKCKNATHRVTKVLRVSTDLLADTLHEHENLKVIHLFRDPRAIINSRMQTKWNHTSTEDGLIGHAKSVCNKMLYDFRQGKKLLKLYPGRFKFIYYEDLTEKPFDKSKELFKYLGMDLHENKYPHLRNIPVFRNASDSKYRVKNTAFWWRVSLKWSIVEKMESVCKDVYAELGYKSLVNAEEYRNLSISSVNFPKEYLIF